MKRIIIYLTLFVIKGVTTFGQNVLYYHPNAAGLALGKSFDLFNPSTAFASDIFKTYKTIQSGRTTQDVYMSVIDNKQSYRNTLHIDASLDASFLSLFSANASYTKDETQLFNENSLTICLQGIADFGNYTITEPELNAGVRELASQPEIFKQTYGEYYVSSVHKEQILYVFITLNNISQSLKQQMSAELGGGGGIASIFSADAQFRMNKIMEQFKNSKAFTIRVKSFGKNVLTELPITAITDDFFRNGDFSSTTYNSIIRYINTYFTPENSSVSEYYYSPLSQFGYRNDDYFNKIFRKYKKYINLCQEYNKYNLLENEAKQITEFRTYSIRTSADETFIKNARKVIGTRLDDLTDALSACRQNECSSLSQCCNIKDIEQSIDADKLDFIRNTYISPLGDFNFFQLSNPTRYDLFNNYPGGVVDVFSRISDNFSKLNIKENNPQTYTIQANLAFVNNIKGHAKYSVTLWINGFPMGSTGIEGDYNSVLQYNWVSDPIPIGKKFNNNYPQKVQLQIVALQLPPGLNPGEIYITVLPYSRLFFNFFN